MLKPMKVVALVALALTSILSVTASPAAGQAAENGCPPGQPSGRPPGVPPAQPGQGDGRPPQYPPGRCQLALSQAAGQRGDTFQATGNGFVPGEQVSLSLGRQPLTTATADANGAFAATLTVPADAAIGRTEVLAAGQSQQLSAAFEVLGDNAAAAAAPSRSSGTLPRTGAELAAIGLFGVVLTVGGALLVQATRRRREVPTS